MNDSQKLIIAKKILLGFDGLGQAEIVEGQAIFVKNNKINEIGPTSVLRQKYKEIPDQNEILKLDWFHKDCINKIDFNNCNLGLRNWIIRNKFLKYNNNDELIKKNTLKI